MSAPVDVRQWLGDERFMYGPSTESRAKCDEVFTAMAELIEAVEVLAKLADDASTEGRFADGIGDELDALEAVQAALARVKGGAA